MANASFRRRRRTSVWLIILICLISLELGGYLGIYLSQWQQFKWAAVALEIGNERPWVLATPLHDASILIKTRLNAGSAIGLCLGLGIYGLLRRR